MSLAGFESSIPASEWLQTVALDRSAIGIGLHLCYCCEILVLFGRVVVLFQRTCDEQHDKFKADDQSYQHQEYMYSCRSKKQIGHYTLLAEKRNKSNSL